MKYDKLTEKQKKVADKISKGLAEDKINMSPVEVVILALSYLDDKSAEHFLSQVK